MPAGHWENFPICASSPGLQLERNSGAVGVLDKPWSDRMRLVLQLVARLLVVVALCLGAATIWATIDAYRSVDRATAASAERVSQAMAALYWPELLLRSSRARALLMALAIAFFASLAIAHTLAPAQQIVAALQRMAHGQYRTSLPRFRSMELAMIGQAVGDLGERLAQAMEERAVLTRRLLEIRNDERRALARELHDEFGQNVSAILAFASMIAGT